LSTHCDTHLFCQHASIEHQVTQDINQLDVCGTFWPIDIWARSPGTSEAAGRVVWTLSRRITTSSGSISWSWVDAITRDVEKSATVWTRTTRKTTVRARVDVTGEVPQRLPVSQVSWVVQNLQAPKEARSKREDVRGHTRRRNRRCWQAAYCCQNHRGPT